MYDCATGQMVKNDLISELMAVMTDGNDVFECVSYRRVLEIKCRSKQKTKYLAHVSVKVSFKN